MEMIEYSTATHCAEQWRKSMEAMGEAMRVIDSELDALGKAFQASSGFDFTIAYCGRNWWKPSEFDQIQKIMKISAWQTLIQKLGIEKIMSSKRQQELRDILLSNDPRDADKLPDIDETTIMEVLKGYVSSADEFLQESIVEEFDNLRPGRHGTCRQQYATNQVDKVGERVIVTYAFDSPTYGNTWRVRYGSRRSQLIALDRIFHALDGKGLPKGHYGPLVSSIETTPIGEKNRGDRIF